VAEEELSEMMEDEARPCEVEPDGVERDGYLREEYVRNSEPQCSAQDEVDQYEEEGHHINDLLEPRKVRVARNPELYQDEQRQ